MTEAGTLEPWVGILLVVVWTVLVSALWHLNEQIMKLQNDLFYLREDLDELKGKMK